jgi:hypothetical protein
MIGGITTGPLPGSGIPGKFGGPKGPEMIIGGNSSDGKPATVKSGGAISGGVIGGAGGISTRAGMGGSKWRTFGRARA